GSVLCGPSEFIAEGRRIRKGLGGGMRQAGILAAAGMVALDTMIDRLADDHTNAKALAEGLNKIHGVDVDLNSVQTNMIYFTLTTEAVSDEQLISSAVEKGVKFLSIVPRAFRMVTHHGIERGDIDTAIEIVREIINQ
ncbi:MAG: beta-eliminating lyase-related protein, partial [Planctomycetota bacterium]